MKAAPLAATVVVMSLAALLCSPAVLAHPDDPKARDQRPAYVGPGYKAGSFGAIPVGFSSSLVTLESWFPIGEFAGGHPEANDCWGYVSPSGREYAIIKLRKGTGFVEVTDPANAFIVDTILGPDSLWGDVKTYAHYAYAVTESNSVGLQIIDLSAIDSGVVTLVNEVESGVGSGKTHNVVIDPESGYLYRTGGFHYGLGIYDLNSDPVDPPQVASWGNRYVHDAQVVTYKDGPYAGREIVFACTGDNGGWVNTGLEILDVTDKSNILELARYYYSNGEYSHQAWLSPDRRYLYLNDELDESELGISTETKVIDVSTLTNPFEATTFTNGNAAIGHNLYARGALVFEANYTSGLRIFDASDPLAASEVAYFDTFTPSDGVEYSGLWSNYPLLPSGTILGSDRQSGLFVWSLDSSLVDATPPTASITSPDAGVWVGATLNAAASASDDVAILSVEFVLDDGVNPPVSACDTDAPYAKDLSTLTLSCGAATLTVHATDSWGNVTTQTLAVEIDHEAPQAGGSAPPDGSVLSSLAAATFFVTDVCSGIDVAATEVNVRRDDAVLSEGADYTVDAGTPGEITIAFGAPQDGVHDLAVTPIDLAANTGDTLEVQIIADSVDPATSVTEPPDGACIGGARVSVTAAATDDVGVALVTFSIDDGVNPIVTADDPAPPYEVALDTTTLADGPATLSVTATDDAGNDATDAIVVIVDNTAPTAVCQDITVALVGGSVGITAADVDGGSSDTCGVAALSVTPDGFTCADLGANAVTLTVTDGAGRTAECTATVTVEDVSPPTVTCPADVTTSVDAGACTAAVVVAAPLTGDDCGVASIVNDYTGSADASGTYPLGTTPVTWTVTDASGLETQCVMNVIVEDDDPPVIACAGDIETSVESGLCGAVVTYAVPAGTDGCPDATTTQTAGLGSGATFPVGVTTETYTVTDAAGQSATCSFTVTVIDDEPPAIACPANIVVGADAGGCSAIVAYTPPTGTDACGGAVTVQTAGLGSGASFPVGTTTETYTVTDAAGNDASCSFTVTVTDTQPPAITCPANIVVSADDGLCGAVVGYTPPIGMDACGGVTSDLTSGLGSGSVFPVGTTTELYTATDAAGNTATCSFTVTVVDDEPPTLACPANVVVSADAGVCTAVVSYTPPAGTDHCAGAMTELTSGLGSGATFPVGTTTELYTAIDAAGNTTTCSFTVTVVDDEPPTLACPANIVASADGGDCTAVVSYVAPAGVDNCAGAVTELTSGLGSGGTFPVGTTTETYTVTDAAGASATCSFTVTIVDDGPPTIACPANIVVSADPGACTAVVSYTPPIGTDGCAGATTMLTSGLGSGATFPVGVTMETYTVTDAAGASATCSFTVTVVDDEPPTLACPANIVVPADAGSCSAVVSYTPPAGADNCAGVATALTSGLGSGAAFALGTTTETYTATDAAGNTATCSFTVTVVDEQPPTLACPANIVVSADPDACSAVVSYTPPAGADDCGDATTALTSGLGSGGVFPTGATVETYTATDAAGNESTCSFTITVVDEQPPIIACPPAPDAVIADATCVATVPDLLAALDASDNCTPAGALVLTQTPAAGTTVGAGLTPVTLTVTDAGGLESTCALVLEVLDVDPPSVTGVPDDVAVACDAVPAPPPTLPASDACDATVAEASYDGETSAAGVCPGDLELTRSWTATDSSGNSTTITQLVTTTDTAAPTLVVPPALEVECGTSTDPSVTGAASASDACDPAPIVSFSDDVGPGACALESIITRTWIATDWCGNTASGVQTIAIVDTTAPLITSCPAGVTVAADAGGCTATLVLTPATATDGCDPAPIVGATRSDGLGLNDPYPAGDTVVTWGARDVCGNISTCEQTVTVEPHNVLVVDVALDGLVASPLTRCVEFELLEAGGDALVVERELTFIDGVAAAFEMPVPCGVYACIRARDRLHGLWSADATFEIDDATYRAAFIDQTGSGAADTTLRLGNANGDTYIDIVDFALFLTQVGEFLDPSDCDAAGPHTDFSGNGLVLTEDFSYILINFLEIDELPACQPRLDGPSAPPAAPHAVTPMPRLAVRLDELPAQQAFELMSADLNDDGWIDLADVDAFVDGARPRAHTIGAGGSWNDPATWDTRVAPAADHDAVIDARVTIDTSWAAARDVVVAAGGVLRVDGGALSARSITVRPRGTLEITAAAGGVFTDSLAIEDDGLLRWSGGPLQIGPQGLWLADAGTLEVTLAPRASGIVVAGAARLGGRLAVRTSPVLYLERERELLRAWHVEGVFSTIQAAGLRVFVDDTRVIVRPGAAKR